MLARPLRLTLPALAALSLAAPPPAVAGPAVFARVGQTAGFDGGDVAFAWSVSVDHRLTEQRAEASPEGGGGTGGGGTGGGGGGGGGTGGGTGTATSTGGVQHRIGAFYGLTPWLTFGVEQTLRQPGPSDVSLGVLVPEARVHLGELLGGALAELPVDVVAFVAGRVRVRAQRDPSVVAGAGVERSSGAWRLAADAGFEATVTGDVPERGLRYRLGGSWLPLEASAAPVSVALEAWGSMVWPDGGDYSADHHAGPSVTVRLDPIWIGASLAAGLKDRVSGDDVEMTTLARVGAGW